MKTSNTELQRWAGATNPPTTQTASQMQVFYTFRRGSTDGPTDGPTDGAMGKTSYRVANRVRVRV